MLEKYLSQYCHSECMQLLAILTQQAVFRKVPVAQSQSLQSQVEADAYWLQLLI